MSNEFVLPGDHVGNSIEYLPGFGVYAEEDDLYSSNIGNLEIDSERRLARLNIKTRVPKLQGIGTITFGVVAGVTSNSAIVDLVPVQTKNLHLIPRGVPAVLRVSEVKRGFVEDLHSEIKSGDIIKVKIIDVSRHTVSLSINRGDLGVVKASCLRCRSMLEKQGYKLKCPKCGYVENRKLSSEYDSVKI